MNNKRYNIGTVGMTMQTNGFPKGFILKRDLTLRECKHILGNLLGIELSTREDCYDNEEYRDKMDDTVIPSMRGSEATQMILP